MDNKTCVQTSLEAKGSTKTLPGLNLTHNPGTALAIKLVSLSPLRHLRAPSTNLKVVSFLFGLTLSFFVVASYILTWDRKALLLVPSPSQLRPSAVTHATNNSLDMKSVVMTVTLKLEYKPRRVPDRSEVVSSDPLLFSAIPRQFLPRIKNPCWLAEFSNEPAADPYEKNLFKRRSKSFRELCDNMRTHFQGHLYHIGGKLQRVRCLPYFYIIGQPKCGTTDLFQRLRLHAQVRFAALKEPHWWTRKRFGYIRFKDGLKERFPLEDYLDVFDKAAQQIQEHMAANSSKEHSEVKLITGEASPSTMWDNQAWSYIRRDKDQREPLLLAQDFIHTVQPNAKIFVMLRDPSERLYSDYLYFKAANKSVEDFHQKVLDSVQLFQSCLLSDTLRYCVYDTGLSNSMPFSERTKS